MKKSCLVQRIVRLVMRTEPKASYLMAQYEYACRYTPNIYIYIYIYISWEINDITCSNWQIGIVLVRADWRPGQANTNTGPGVRKKYWLNAETVNSHEGVWCCPARSSTDVCQRGTGSPQDWFAKAMASTIHGLTSAWRQPSLSADFCNRSAFVLQVCLCTTENSWAESSTVSQNSPAWETGVSRKHILLMLLISARLSHRWRSWTTNVDIAFPRGCAVTFLAQRAKSVTERRFLTSTSGRYYPCAFVWMSWLGVLQDSHGMQGRGGSAHKTVSFGSESRHQLTAFG